MCGGIFAIAGTSSTPELGDEDIGSNRKPGDESGGDESQQLSQSHGGNRGGTQPAYEKDGDNPLGTLQQTADRYGQGQCEYRFTNPGKRYHRAYPNRSKAFPW